MGSQSRSVSDLALVFVVRIWHRRSAPPFPANLYTPVKLVKIDGPGEHQQSGGDQVLAPLTHAGEPRARNDSHAFGSDVVAALRDLAQMINERLQFESLGGE
jgi:hypothetical protein